MQSLSMNEVTTYRWSFEQDVDNFQDAGYEAIGVWLQKLLDYGEDQAIDLVARSDLHVSNVVWAGGFTGSDGRPREECLSDTIHALRISAALGADCLVTYAGGRNHHTMRHAQRLLCDALDELLPIAEITEVPLAIEPMHPACAAGWTFLTDLNATLDLLDTYNSPYLQLALDTYHFPVDRLHPRVFERVASHLGIVHLGDHVVPHSLDCERCQLGEGNVGLERSIARLVEAGYTGDFDVKLLGAAIEGTDYWTTLQNSHRAFSSFTAEFATLK